jgi:hypothetical protein
VYDLHARSRAMVTEYPFCGASVVILSIRLITWLTCIALVVISLPLVVYLRAHDALDASADVAIV